MAGKAVVGMKRAFCSLLICAAVGLVFAGHAFGKTYVVMLKKGANPTAVAQQHAARFSGRIVHVYGTLDGYAIDLPANSRAPGLIARDPLVSTVEASQTTVIPAGPDSVNVTSVVSQYDPYITGSPYVGQTLIGYDGEWYCDSVCNTATMTWERINSSGVVVATVAGPTNISTPYGTTTYTVASADLGYRLRIKVRRCDSSGCTTAYSASTPAIANSPSPPTLSIGDRERVEGNSGTTNFQFSVSLSASSGSTVTVAYATGSGNATAGVDYGATSGTLTIPAGQTSGTVTVPVYGDTTYEASETFAVTLSSPTNATIADGIAIGTIFNDDPDPNFNPCGSALQILPHGADRIEADKSSQIANDCEFATNTRIGILDTGVNASDLTLAADQYSCIRDGNGNLIYADDNGHGTQVASIAAAKDDTAGIVGVAPGASVVSFKVAKSDGTVTTADAICGLDAASGTLTDQDSSNDVRVANMSFGFTNTSDDGNCGNTNGDTLHQAICRARDRGLTIVAAAGNTFADFSTVTPAAYDEVLTVTAMADYDGVSGGAAAVPGGCSTTTPDDRYWNDSVAGTGFALSSADQAHTIAAPGVCDMAMNKDGTRTGYVLIGASFAAPHATGAVALCIASGACSGLTVSQIVVKIISDAQSYRIDHASTYGYTGDPFNPVSGKYFGYLVAADPY